MKKTARMRISNPLNLANDPLDELAFPNFILFKSASTFVLGAKFVLLSILTVIDPSVLTVVIVVLRSPLSAGVKLASLT
jgi:hypothetical protein